MYKRYEVGDQVKIFWAEKEQVVVIVGFDDMASDDLTVQEFTISVEDGGCAYVSVAEFMTRLVDDKPRCPVCKGKEMPAHKMTLDGDQWLCSVCNTQWYPNPIGRPSLGTTKKQSLTLQDDTWQWIDNAVADGLASNRSEFLRDIIEYARTGVR